MSMHFVSSTLVDSIGYHNGNLYIQFKNGNLYEYFNVPFRHYQGMLAAKSVGKYYGRYIRGQYPRKKIAYNL
ncbi:KTSC domain-containing protein [Eubacterium maltosivorans]|nr:KTSC domain-containing protein [Eubacterium maltosivorans]